MRKNKNESFDSISIKFLYQNFFLCRHFPIASADFLRQSGLFSVSKGKKGSSLLASPSSFPLLLPMTFQIFNSITSMSRGKEISKYSFRRSKGGEEPRNVKANLFNISICRIFSYSLFALPFKFICFSTSIQLGGGGALPQVAARHTPLGTL